MTSTRANTSEGKVVVTARALVCGQGKGWATPAQGRATEASPVPVFELDDVIEQKIEVREPSQPHVVPNTAQMLRVLIVRLLPRLDSAPNSSICPGIAVPSLALPRFLAPLVSSSVVMYVAEKKSFERFVRLTPSKTGGDQSDRWTGGPVVGSLTGRANRSYAPSSLASMG
ncbi:hypothetical protein KY285_010304 [Solanum tuberosum]|nr:hypothetical protein KY289_010847 [Solanum tuberosum]KAH0734597.1 hypothetical protein KY285_010304 [Solanum tuberosum]